MKEEANESQKLPKLSEWGCELSADRRWKGRDNVCQGERGRGVNISEGARHQIGLLQYNPSTETIFQPQHVTPPLWIGTISNPNTVKELYFIQSTEVSVPSSQLAFPASSPGSECVPSWNQKGGGHTRWVERGWGVNSSEDDRHCSVLYIRKYFVIVS